MRGLPCKPVVALEMVEDVVLAGTFHYLAEEGGALMTPGAVLLGERGRCFACGHEHGEGDRCVSFQFGPALLERIAADAGARRTDFAIPRLPPSRRTAALAARAARALAEPQTAEETALALAGLALRADGKAPLPQVGARDLARAAAAAQRIEAAPHEPHTIASLAREAELSSFRFLRAFKAAVGASPHQFLRRHSSRRRSSAPRAAARYPCAAVSQSRRRSARRWWEHGRAPGSYRKAIRALSALGAHSDVHSGILLRTPTTFPSS